MEQLIKFLEDKLQEMVPQHLKEKGWKYQDWPGTFSPEAWDYLLALIGEGEYQLIIYSKGTKNGEPFKRGQMFISPQGYSNLQDKDRRARLAVEMNFK